MPLQKQVFTNFTPGKWAAFINKIKANTGVQITTFSGIVTHGSFEFAYTYDKISEVLTVQCLNKPFFINQSTIINGLAEEIADLIPVTPEPVFKGDSAVPVVLTSQVSEAPHDTV